MNLPETPHRKRCRRWNTPGQAHYLTFSCYQRRPFLSRDLPRNWFLDALARARMRFAFDLWAYVIMPEHAHLLLWPRESPYSISAILHAIKLSVARKAIAHLQRIHSAGLAQLAHPHPDGSTQYRFWQAGGGYDRNLYSGNEVWEKIRYIHHNPVKRQLVEKATQWCWSSATFYEGAGPGPVPIDVKSIPWARS